MIDLLDIVRVEALHWLHLRKDDVASMEVPWLCDWLKERAVIWVDRRNHGRCRGLDFDGLSSQELVLEAEVLDLQEAQLSFVVPFILRAGLFLSLIHI